MVRRDTVRVYYDEREREREMGESQKVKGVRGCGWMRRVRERARDREIHIHIRGGAKGRG